MLCGSLTARVINVSPLSRTTHLPLGGVVADDVLGKTAKAAFGFARTFQLPPPWYFTSTMPRQHSRASQRRTAFVTSSVCFWSGSHFKVQTADRPLLATPPGLVLIRRTTSQRQGLIRKIEDSDFEAARGTNMHTFGSHIKWHQRES